MDGQPLPSWPVIDGKPLWYFTRLMSLQNLRPWELEYAPLAVMNLYFAVTEQYASGRLRADREHEARAKEREATEKALQAAEEAATRQEERLSRFEQIEREQQAARAGQADPGVVVDGE